MPLDTWFPLAVYYTDLDDAASHNEVMQETILQLEQDAGERRFENTAWTGDIHGVGSLHYDERFDWLTGQVEKNCVEYLKALGHDMNKIDLYIQRSWPIISRKDEGVSVHAHHNANISAVYYVEVPETDDLTQAGPFVIHNSYNQNELQGGITTEGTNAISGWNELNYQKGYYMPVPGRLLIFPSKQAHSVEPNQTASLRISISFDIVMAASHLNPKETLEFLAPPLEQWKPFEVRCS